MGSLIDMKGKKFGRLTVIGRSDAQPTDNGKVFWDCVCDCGSHVRAEGWNLRNGVVRSCGCLQRDVTTTHGGSNDRLYKVWSSMKHRCQNKNDPAYRFYGEKGIKVCDEWLKYQNFKKWAVENGYKRGLTIDRIDSNKDYCPLNCRWISHSENSRRIAKNILTVDGVTMSYRDWKRRLGVGDMCIEHWVERHGEEYAVRRIAATMHPEKFTEKELDELGIYKNKRKYVTINGETLSYSGWAKRIGFSHRSVLLWVQNHGEEYANERIKRALAEIK